MARHGSIAEQRHDNDNIKWSGRGKRPSTPDFILWDELKGGLSFSEAFATWDERDLYVSEDCKFGNTPREYPTCGDYELSIGGAVIAFRTFRYGKAETLKEGKNIFCAALPDAIDADGYVRKWSGHWFWIEQDAIDRLEKRQKYISKLMGAA